MAKRMVLVDEKLLEYKPMLQHYRDKQDLSWKRPTEQTVKSSLSKGMKSTLSDSTIPDDIKAKQHRQNLSRFLQTKRKLIEEPQAIVATEEEPLIDLQPTVDELLGGVKKKKKKKRKSERVKKKPERYADIDWEAWK